MCQALFKRGMHPWCLAEAQNSAAPKLPRFTNQKPAAGGAPIAKYEKMLVHTSGRCIARRGCKVGSASCFLPPSLRFKILILFYRKLRKQLHSAANLKRHAASCNPGAREHRVRSRVAQRSLVQHFFALKLSFLSRRWRDELAIRT